MTEVTIAALVYKDWRYIEWLHSSLRAMAGKVPWRLVVTACNPQSDEIADKADHVYCEDGPFDHYLDPVYRAWNDAVLTAPTQWVVLANSDMYFADWALDYLVAAKKADPKCLPCSLLVESGRIPSGMPEYVRDFGTKPETFKADEFKAYAKEIEKPGETEPGRLYMPVLFDRCEFLDVGGYEPNRDVAGGTDGPIHTSGDKLTFARFAEAGFNHVTALGSVCAHLQEGEGRDV